MTKKVLLALVLVGGLFSLLWLTRSQSHSSPASSVPSRVVVSAKLAGLERGWVKNEGQWDEETLFSAPGYFGTTWIAKDGKLVHVAVKGKESWVISERWVGGKVQAIKGEEELQTKVSYFVGSDPSKHKTNLPTYRYISLGEVWSGVEVKLKATQKTVEKLFYVKPGADPSKIVVEVEGAEGLKLSKDGEIIIQTGLGELKLSKPIAWQEKDGKKLPVEVSYKLIDKNRYSFEVAKADQSVPLVIDPILQATYLGGSGNDEAYALAIHPQTGEVYVAGYTESTKFPKTTGGAQANYGGGGFGDVFVARLNKDLTQILQSTYLGGSNSDSASALVIHPKTGEVYVAGSTDSKDFPKTTGGAQANKSGDSDAFVARLSKELTQILQSTYLGGSKSDYAFALAIHPTTGEVYVAGETKSTDFPKTDGGAQTTNRGGTDTFLARLNRDLTQILQSTYLGGSSLDTAYALAIHPKTGEVYVAGKTDSTDFPKTDGGAQEKCNGCKSSFPLLGSADAFVTRLNSDLTQILQSTYLGGRYVDIAYALAIHPKTGEVYVAGATNSADFPKTDGGAQEKCSSCGRLVPLLGQADAFVARLNKELTQILQSTYLGEKVEDHARALAIHPKTGEVYVAGSTNSRDFPRTTGGAQAAHGGGLDDAFVARLNEELTQILQSTYLGGGGNDEIYALAIHPTTGEVYVAGKTESTNFPNTTGGAQATNGGGTDAFVARLSADLSAGRKSAGGGFYTTSSASSVAGVWNILLLLSVPAFALARRIRKK
uniref:DUF7948 domain-containing protein n=1 Tax=Thermocrinis ruber TaxID=75906 RepID=A0A7C5SX68_9AQUI